MDRKTILSGHDLPFVTNVLKHPCRSSLSALIIYFDVQIDFTQSICKVMGVSALPSQIQVSPGLNNIAYNLTHPRFAWPPNRCEPLWNHSDPARPSLLSVRALLEPKDCHGQNRRILHHDIPWAPLLSLHPAVRHCSGLLILASSSRWYCRWFY